ncbi:MAG: hypothetical protein KBG10_02300 [Anaerolineaceae bacterium]|nr:hypothetical protein [Anaerolineaceae bacterium]
MKTKKKEMLKNKLMVSFLLACVICTAFPITGQAQSGFSLVNGVCTGADMDDSLSEEWHYFWKNLRIDFTQQEKNIYSGYGEASTEDKVNEGFLRLIDGYIQVEYDAQTGNMEGTFEVVHTDSYTLKDGKGYDVILTFSGSVVKAEVDPTSSQVTLYLRGPLEQDWVSRGYEPQSTISPGVQIEQYLMTVAFNVEGALPGWSCSPLVLGIEGLQPGDTIAPSATYYLADGTETEVLNERWTINDQETDALVWNGEETTILLEWTCPDDEEYSTSFVIPAYAGPVFPTETPEPTATALPQPTKNETLEVPAGSDGEQNSQGGLSSPGIIGIAVGVTGLIGLAAAYLSGAIKTSAIMEAAPKALVPTETSPNSIPDTVPPVQKAPDSTAAVSPKSSVNPQEIQEEPPRTRDTKSEREGGKEKLSPAERAKLIGLRNEMVNEMERYKSQWHATRDAVNKLKSIKKKNLIKFIVKQGIETQDWIMTTPVDVLSKVVIDPAVESLMQKPDSSQDGSIIVAINTRIEKLQAEMKQMVNEVYYLNREINKIDRKLGK